MRLALLRLSALGDILRVLPAWANLHAACDRVVVVLRAADHPLAPSFTAMGCTVAACADAAGGMGHSLAAGVRAAPGAAGWIVALADMPFIQPASHRAVVAALRAGEDEVGIGRLQRGAFRAVADEDHAGFRGHS